MRLQDPQQISGKDGDMDNKYFVEFRAVSVLIQGESELKALLSVILIVITEFLVGFKKVFKKRIRLFENFLITVKIIFYN